MRYTTIIDISEFPAIYRNRNARLLYIHMALKAGYHDYDRDLLTTSIRSLSSQTGLTVSAVRHALLQLESCQLLTRDGLAWRVKKFVLEEKPSSRRQANTTKITGELTEAMRKQKAEEEQRIRVLEEWFRTAPRDELERALGNLQAHRHYIVNGQRIYPTAKAIEAIIDKLKKT